MGFIVLAGRDISTEGLSKSNFRNGWKKTVDSPVRLTINEFVASSDNRFLYSIGHNSRDIYKYSCSGNIDSFHWTKVDTKTSFDVIEPVVLRISNELSKKLCF